VVLLALAVGAAAFAAEPTLKVGDPAPKIQNGKWVQGEPVKNFDRDKAYLVEFWATWFGPCRESVPRLNEQFLKFKDKKLVVIGQDCLEEDDSLVAPFVKSLGEKMAYRVALDDKITDKRGVMAQTWMAPAGLNSIPMAFLIGKDGRIAWIGHPMALKDSVIEAVLAGNYDAKKAAAEYAQQARDKARRDALFQDYNTARERKKWDEALAKLDEFEKLLPKEHWLGLSQQRFSILLTKKDYKGAYKVAEQMSDAHPEDANMQNELAWDMATDLTIEQRDLALAEKIATRAVLASKSTQPEILDTLACILFMEGERFRAATVEGLAASVATGDDKHTYQKTAESYIMGTDKPDVLNRQAEQFKDDGKLAEAEGVWREELAVEQKLWDTNSARWEGTVEKLADICVAQGKMAEAETEYREVLEISQKVLGPEHPDTLDIMRHLAEFCCSIGHDTEATALLEKACELDPNRTTSLLTLATWQAWFGQDAGYEATRRRLLQQAQGTNIALQAEPAAKAFCLKPSTDAVLLTSVLNLAQRSVELGKGSGRLPWDQLALGLAEYRNGQYAAAEKTLTVVEQTAGNLDIQEPARLFRAMSLFRQDRLEDARTLFSKAEAQMPPFPKDESKPLINGRLVNRDVLICWLAYKEARALIGTHES